MEHELYHSSRPREQRAMRGRRGRAIDKGDPRTRRAKSARRLARASPATARTPNKLIERGLNGDSCGGMLAWLVAGLAERLDRDLHPVLRRTLHALDRHDSPLLKKHELMRAVGFAVSFHDRWVRKPADWEPDPAKKEHGQLNSLLRHLFCRYRVPVPFLWAWLNDDGSVFCTRGREWFIHVGNGGSLRRAEGLPYPLSRAAAHAVLAAPESLTLPQALRYGQFIALGVSEELALAAVRTQLGRSRADDAAAVVVARFLAQHENARARDVQQMVDYVIARRRGYGELAPQPRFVLAGRTPRTLMVEIRQWHELVNRMKSGQHRAWSSCGIDGFEQAVMDEQGEAASWRIVELTTSAELEEEGRAMHHCVATCAWNAAQHECAIFALRRDEGGRTQHVATIEVLLPSRQVAQFQGPCNQQPTAGATEIVARWASLRGIDLSTTRRA